jgi:hypothetical protein
MAKASVEKPPIVRRVYSYIRFSDPQQADGVSTDRQQENADSYCKRHPGYVLDKTLDVDIASAFHGDHRKKGVLGVFLKFVETGKIARGSILLVENVDRFSREGVFVTLRESIFKMFEHGIALHTIAPEVKYEPGCENGTEFIGLMLYIQAAHAASARRSDLMKDARARERGWAQASKRIMTKQAPHWIALKEHKDRSTEWIFKPGGKEAINLIFKLKLQGLGNDLITERLNAEAIWEPKRKLSKGWRKNYVRKILRSRTVIGEQQFYTRIGPDGKRGKRVPVGKPIENYFPITVLPETFLAVQAVLKSRHKTGGRNGQFRNVLKSLTVCPYCGGKMNYEDHGRPTHGALHCEQGSRGHSDCDNRTISYAECEALVLENCEHLRPDQILPNPSDHAEKCKRLELATKGRAQEIIDKTAALENLARQTGEQASPRVQATYRAVMEKISTSLDELERRQAEQVAELTERRSAPETMKHLQADLGRLREKMRGKGKDKIALRMQLNAALRELITKIEIYADGHKDVFDEAGEEKAAAEILALPEGRELRKLSKHKDTWKEYYARLHRHPIMKAIGDGERMGSLFAFELSDAEIKAPRGFFKWVREQRMSSAGRFIRVHFKTGETIDFAPPGSCGSGERLVTQRGGKKLWKYVDPDAKEMLRMYNARRPVGVQV